jgi:hypothetical protein
MESWAEDSLLGQPAHIVVVTNRWRGRRQQDVNTGQCSGGHCFHVA